MMRWAAGRAALLAPCAAPRRGSGPRVGDAPACATPPEIHSRSTVTFDEASHRSLLRRPDGGGDLKDD